MAINFLNSIDLNQNELKQARVENRLDNPPNAVEGQLYFNTIDSQLRIYAGGDWGDVGGGIATVGGTAPISVGTVGQAVTVAHDTQGRTDNLIQESPGYGGTFTVIKSITATAQGHLSVVDTQQVTLPALQDTTYTIGTSRVGSNGAKFTLTPDNGSGDLLELEFQGVDQEVTITRDNTVTPNILNVGLPNTVTTRRLSLTGLSTQDISLSVTKDASISRDLAVGGTGSFVGEVTIPNGTQPTSAVNLTQLQNALSGNGGFKGAYDAVNNNPALTGGSNVASANGDYYIVSVGGQFFTETVSPGDFIYANTIIAANTDPGRGVYTLVQSVSSIAAEGSTDGATTKGNAGFDSENFDVSNTGWVQLKTLRNPHGAYVSLDSAESYVQKSSVVGGVTSFIVSADNAAVFGTGAQARRIKAEIVEDSSGDTVYADVTRASSGGNITFTFTGNIADGDYYVLLTYVGDSSVVIA